MKTFLSPFAIPFRVLFIREYRTMDGELAIQELFGEQINFSLHISFSQPDIYMYKEAVYLYILEDF